MGREDDVDTRGHLASPRGHPLEGGPENHAHFGLVLFRPSRGTHHPHLPLEGLNVHIPSSRGAHHPLAGLNVHIPSFKGA